PAERARLLGALPISPRAVFGGDAHARAVAYLRAYSREPGLARGRDRRRARVVVRQWRARVAYEDASGPPSVFGEARGVGTRAVAWECAPGRSRRTIRPTPTPARASRRAASSSHGARSRPTPCTASSTTRSRA